jgi:hypothetical protein
LYHHFDDFFGMIGTPKRWGHSPLMKNECRLRALEIQPPHVMYEVGRLLPQSRLVWIAFANGARGWI